MIVVIVGFGFGFLGALRAGVVASLLLGILAVLYFALWNEKLRPWFEATYAIDWVPADILQLVLLPVSIGEFIAMFLWWLAAGVAVGVVLRWLVKLGGKLLNG